MMLSALEVAGIVELGKASQMHLQRVTLRVHQEDVAMAMQDECVLSAMLADKEEAPHS